jgi:hypothetical protein
VCSLGTPCTDADVSLTAPSPPSLPFFFCRCDGAEWGMVFYNNIISLPILMPVALVTGEIPGVLSAPPLAPQPPRPWPAAPRHRFHRCAPPCPIRDRPRGWLPPPPLQKAERCCLPPAVAAARTGCPLLYGESSTAFLSCVAFSGAVGFFLNLASFWCGAGVHAPAAAAAAAASHASHAASNDAWRTALTAAPSRCRGGPPP